MSPQSFDAQKLVRQHILDMPAYEPILPFEVLSQQLGLAPAQIIKLDANENPYGLLPAVRQALAEMPYAHIYPDPGCRFLLSALAKHLQVPQVNLLPGAGADELIDLLMRLLIEPGDTFINCPPTFGMYAFDGDLNCAHRLDVPRRSDFSLDIPAIESAVQSHHPKLLFLASPNNPDGGLALRSEIERLLELPIVLALDEAYIEFAPPGSSWIREVSQRQNLVVIRTFSKWAGLAGLRIGYGAFPSSLVPHLWKIRQPYNVSTAALTAATAAIEHDAEVSEVGARLLAERQRLLGILQGISWLQPYPSHTNFILCRVFGRQASQVKQDLARQGILIRYFNKPGLRDCIRISVGRPEHSDALIRALRQME